MMQEIQVRKRIEYAYSGISNHNIDTQKMLDQLLVDQQDRRYESLAASMHKEVLTLRSGQRTRQIFDLDPLRERNRHQNQDLILTLEHECVTLTITLVSEVSSVRLYSVRL